MVVLEGKQKKYENEKRKEGEWKIAFRGRKSYKVCLHFHSIFAIARQESAATLDTSSPHFSSGKSPHARKARRGGESFLSHRHASPFLRGLIFTRARVSLSMGTTRSLQWPRTKEICWTMKAAGNSTCIVLVTQTKNKIFIVLEMTRKPV